MRPCFPYWIQPATHCKLSKVQRLTPAQLANIEKSGIKAVQNLLKTIEMVKYEYLKSANIDRELIELFMFG